MSKRIATAVAIIGAAGVISGCAFEQPSPGCQVQDSDHPWQAAYTLKNAADASKPCGNLKGEGLGLWKYVKDPLTNPTNQFVVRPEGTASRFSFTYEVQAKNEDGTPEVDDDGKPVMEDETVDRLGLETLEAEQGAAAVLAVKRAASSGTATLPQEPDDQGLCLAQGFDRAATVTAAEVRHKDTNALLVPFESVSYTYKTVTVFSAAEAPGTQASGEFTYRTLNADGTVACEADYTMVALWPQVACDPEAFANPTPANAADRCAEGSGLNPDFDAVCVAGIYHGEGGCVPNGKVPAFKK
jgi:hypothetical protein